VRAGHCGEAGRVLHLQGIEHEFLVCRSRSQITILTELTQLFFFWKIEDAMFFFIFIFLFVA
jgi:hypothetical protein